MDWNNLNSWNGFSPQEIGDLVKEQLELNGPIAKYALVKKVMAAGGHDKPYAACRPIAQIIDMLTNKGVIRLSENSRKLILNENLEADGEDEEINDHQKDNSADEKDGYAARASTNKVRTESAREDSHVSLPPALDTSAVTVLDILLEVLQKTNAVKDSCSFMENSLHEIRDQLNAQKEELAHFETRLDQLEKAKASSQQSSVTRDEIMKQLERLRS